MASLNAITDRLWLYARLTRLDKPIGTLLLLWPTLTALWIASNGRPDWMLVGAFAVGTLLMRSAGCAVNDTADRDFDLHVKRTAARVVTSGAVSPREAIAVALVLTLLAASLLLLMNYAAFLLACLAVVIAATYPFFKRFFPLPQAYLGIAFSFGIPMAFAAVLGEVTALGWWLFIANLFWVIAYDTEYAMVDRDDDIRLGLRSSAILFGRADVAAVMACYGVHFSLLLLVAAQIEARLPFYVGWAAAVGCALYHYALIRRRDRDGCFRAFRHNNWVGFCVFAGVAASYAVR
jgi:4-hydroxybenzoate polyprenyltransferase